MKEFSFVKSSKYHQVTSEEKYTYPRMEGYKMACCDCGLVHYIVMEIVRVTDEAAPFENDEVVTDPQLKVRWKVSRNNRATGQIRKRKHQTTIEYVDDNDKPTKWRPETCADKGTDFSYKE